MITIAQEIHFSRGKAGRRRAAKGAPKPKAPPRVQRISKLMGLAIHFDKLLRGGKVRDMIELAKSKLQQLEQGKTEVPAATVETPNVPPSAVEQALEDIDPDSLSPKEALEVLYRLQELIANKIS